MNKFINKETKTKRSPKKANFKEKAKEQKEETYIECPKCGWIHGSETIRCRFCGQKLKG